MTRRSTYDLGNSLMYLRLAYQAMCRDQAMAEGMVTVIMHDDESLTVRDRLRGLAYAISMRIKELDREAGQ